MHIHTLICINMYIYTCTGDSIGQIHRLVLNFVQILPPFLRVTLSQIIFNLHVIFVNYFQPEKRPTL